MIAFLTVVADLRSLKCQLRMETLRSRVKHSHSRGVCGVFQRLKRDMENSHSENTIRC